jgi:hypothetical protein
MRTREREREKRWRNEWDMSWVAGCWLAGLVKKAKALKENLIEHSSAICENTRRGKEKDEEWYLIKKENEAVVTFLKGFKKWEQSNLEKGGKF